MIRRMILILGAARVLFKYHALILHLVAHLFDVIVVTTSQGFSAAARPAVEAAVAVGAGAELLGAAYIKHSPRQRRTRKTRAWRTALC